MKYITLSLLLVFYWACQPTSKPIPSIFVAHNDVQLTAPIPQYTSTFFSDSLVLTVKETFEGSVVRYSTSKPYPNLDSPVLPNPFSIKEDIHLKLATFHPEMKKSETIFLDFLKSPLLTGIKHIDINPKPNKKYTGDASKILFNLKNGTDNFASGEWLGFNEGIVRITIEFESPKEINEVIISSMSDNDAWIFLPASTTVKTEDNSATHAYTLKSKYQKTSKRLKHLSHSLGGAPTSTLELTIRPFQKIPDWHAGAGGQPWLFIDEIIVR